MDYRSQGSSIQGSAKPIELVRSTVDTIYRNESRRILATLIRLLGDFDLAEEALHEAVAAALNRWPIDGIPSNPRAWLVSTGRFKAIDSLRRRARFGASLAAHEKSLQVEEIDPTQFDDDQIEDDRLRLIFVCCHPALPLGGQLALTLREVCGLRTEEIARAFLTSAPTIAKRIVRAKAKIRDAQIPYEVPSGADLSSRLDTVLQVVYLIFTEGYSASEGSSLTRGDLSEEAVRLARLLAELMPEPEVFGLLALLLLQESRRAARASADGDIILLEDQDRSQWSITLIAEGNALAERALRSRRFGPYTLQAAIAALHAEAQNAASTDWVQITALYDVLLRVNPSPVIALNRAVAISMRDGPAAGLVRIQALLEQGDLSDYYLAHAAHADLCTKLGNITQAIVSYRKALNLARQEPSRRFLKKRLQMLLDRATDG
ncbi:MAG: RNA polymerase sigma factor [Silvibacterium sp.]